FFWAFAEEEKKKIDAVRVRVMRSLGARIFLDGLLRMGNDTSGGWGGGREKGDAAARGGGVDGLGGEAWVEVLRASLSDALRMTSFCLRFSAVLLGWSGVGSLKSCDAGDFFADYEFVDVVGAFVGVDGFEIVHVAHDAVVVDDAVGAEDVAGFAGGVESDAD